MVNPFICGSGAFHHQDDEEEEEETDPFSPRKSSNFRSKYNKNPYSNRGLDKFSALLAELEGKRKKIYTQMGSDEISFVRFVYSNCDDIKPIVVRVRDHNKLRKNNSDVSDHKTHHNNNKIKPMSHNNSSESLTPPNEVRRRKGNELVGPCCCLIMLILAFLALFGRSFAILCTSLWWYLVPAIKGEKWVIGKKQEGGRRVREKKIASVGLPSPPTGEMAGMSPRRQPGHRKSW